MNNTLPSGRQDSRTVDPRPGRPPHPDLGLRRPLAGVARRPGVRHPSGPARRPRMRPRPGRLAGCPVVGVRTWVPFIQDGVTGLFVERLPPGAKCVKNNADEGALAAFQSALAQAFGMDRNRTREDAACSLHPRVIRNTLLMSLEVARSSTVHS